MSLKRQQDIISGFSMASMTDVIFLLLVFFMVTSTFIFPTALEVNLPQGSEQTPLKPQTRVYIQADGSIWGQYADSDAQQFADEDALLQFLSTVHQQDPESAIAVYGDASVQYGDVVNILNLGAANDLKMVLATTPRPMPASADAQAEQPTQAAQSTDIQTTNQ